MTIKLTGKGFVSPESPDMLRENQYYAGMPDDGVSATAVHLTMCYALAYQDPHNRLLAHVAPGLHPEIQQDIQSQVPAEDIAQAVVVLTTLNPAYGMMVPRVRQQFIDIGVKPENIHVFDEFGRQVTTDAERNIYYDGIQEDDANMPSQRRLFNLRFSEGRLSINNDTGTSPYPEKFRDMYIFPEGRDTSPPDQAPGNPGSSPTPHGKPPEIEL
ncbi:hypothetical protein GC177_10355 [bacterium]|nr:hypothetical protein [bacterium]